MSSHSKVASLGCMGLLVLVISIAVFAPHNSPTSETRRISATDAISTGNGVSDQLAGLPKYAQADLLAKVVNDNCTGTDAFFMGAAEDHQAFWSVRCTDGRSFQVAIEPNATGTTSIMNCTLLKAVADVDCFVSFAEQRGRRPRTGSQIKSDLDKLPPAVRRDAEKNLKRNLGEAAK